MKYEERIYRSLINKDNLISYNVKILESQFELIDKINKYTGTGYTNHIPRDISKLYIYETKERYQEELCIFNENYKEYKIIKILLEEKLKEIEERAYQEAYAGDMNPDTIGWQVHLDLNDLDLGNHKIDIQCLEPDGNILADKSIQFTLE